MLPTKTSIYNISNVKKNSKQLSDKLAQIMYYFFSLVIFGIIVLLISNPTKYMSSVNKGISIFFCSVLPSLLPFVFLSKLLTDLGFVSKLSKIFEKPIKKLFGLPPISAYVFLMSILCGYPMGAKIVGDLHEKGAITSDDAKHIVALCSTSGPIFVIGVVGCSMLKSYKLGALIFAAHILSAIFCGLVFRNYKYKQTQKVQTSSTSAENLLAGATTSTIFSVLTVAIYVSIFYMVIDMAYDIKILAFGAKAFEKVLALFGVPSVFSSAMASGTIEMTRGLYELSLVSGLDTYKLALASGVISFGGLSVILQSITFLSKTKTNALYLVLVKSVHMVLSILLAVILAWIFY